MRGLELCSGSDNLAAHFCCSASTVKFVAGLPSSDSIASEPAPVATAPNTRHDTPIATFLLRH